MDDALKKISDELALELKAYFARDDVKDAVEATHKAADKDVGTFEQIITTENLDRYQDVIKIDAWDDEHYLKNPVVLWGHDHKQLPIGITTGLRTENGQKIATGKFAPHAKAQEIRQLYDMGILRAASVGFIEKEREGNLITKAELIEWSIVSVPANPYCLATLVKSGVSVNEMVTKGLVFVDNESKAIVEESVKEKTEEVVETPVVETPEEKHFDTIEIVGELAALEDAFVALEALVKGQTQERDEASQTEESEEKAYREFSEKRRIVQLAATYIGDVLAEARQAKRG